MITICIRKPTKLHGYWRVVGTFSGPDDRYVFVEREFNEGKAAETYARMLVELYRADHFARD
jgi:hypothetical protein